MIRRTGPRARPDPFPSRTRPSPHRYRRFVFSFDGAGFDSRRRLVGARLDEDTAAWAEERYARLLRDAGIGDGETDDVGLFVDALRLAMAGGWRFGDVDYMDTRTGGAATIRAEWA